MKVAITGANRGIGLALTKTYAHSGHRVYAMCRHTSDELAKLDNVRVIEEVDVAKDIPYSLLENGLDSEVELFINNAGIMTVESLEDMNFERIRRQFEVNTLGMLNMVKKMLPFLKGGSKIGVLTSRMGSIGDNHSGSYYGYRMSKAAANAACRSLAIDLKPRGVAVCMLHPGYVRTDMNGGLGDIGADVSARGLYRVLEKLSLENTGSFWRYDGGSVPW